MIIALVFAPDEDRVMPFWVAARQAVSSELFALFSVEVKGRRSVQFALSKDENSVHRDSSSLAVQGVNAERRSVRLQTKIATGEEDRHWGIDAEKADGRGYPALHRQGISTSKESCGRFGL